MYAPDHAVPFSSELVGKIEAWGHARNIIAGGTAKDQFFKLTSELGEWAEGVVLHDGLEIKDGIGDAFVVSTLIARQLGESIEALYLERSLAQNHINSDLYLLAVLGRLGDALAKGQTALASKHLGDLAVELVKAASRHGLGINACLETAYAEIKDRKGVMYNGVFIKSTDERYPEVLAELGLSE